MPPHIKICGTTAVSDAQLCQKVGVGFLGVIVQFPPSPRHVSFQTARTIRDMVTTPLVAVSVNQTLDNWLAIADHLDPRALQLHGDESPELVRELAGRGLKVWKALSGDEATLFEAAQQFTEAGAEAILLDSRETLSDGVIYGGTGKTSDWDTARRLVNAGFRVILAGGLTPENVARAIETVQPWGVDVVSGVEAQKGIKDAQKVREFVENALSIEVQT